MDLPAVADCEVAVDQPFTTFVIAGALAHEQVHRVHPAAICQAIGDVLGFWGLRHGASEGGSNRHLVRDGQDGRLAEI